MKTIRCPSCAAALELDNSLMVSRCTFCGCTITLSPDDLGVDKTTSELLSEMFRGEAAGVFLKQKMEQLNMDEYWKYHAQTISFISEDNATINISYIHMAISGNTSIFMGRANVFLLFADSQIAQDYFNALSSIRFPLNDTRSMNRYLPEITHQFVLKDSRVLVVINRGAHEYPLISFKSLPDVHAAWMISRLENLCCLLQYSGLSLSAMSIKDLYIDPQDHQVFLYGGLWTAQKTTGRGSSGKPFESELLAVRRIAAEVIGHDRIEACQGAVPEAFYSFLIEKPKDDAYADFEWWDISLALAYGKRKFQKLDLNESTLI
jgi:hypothetical protein